MNPLHALLYVYAVGFLSRGAFLLGLRAWRRWPKPPPGMAVHPAAVVAIHAVGFLLEMLVWPHWVWTGAVAGWNYYRAARRSPAMFLSGSGAAPTFNPTSGREPLPRYPLPPGFINRTPMAEAGHERKTLLGCPCGTVIVFCDGCRERGIAQRPRCCPDCGAENLRIIGRQVWRVARSPEERPDADRLN